MAVDWSTWEPRERGVLCFIIQEGQILLIEKKRGLGAGKVNGPGGRIDPGETPLEAAVRETREEVGVVPLNVRESGVLRFQFADGYSLHCTVFRADGYEGVPTATAEADPFWTDVGSVPYGRMWADDIHWFPHLLADEAFAGWFEFDGDRMVSMEVKTGRLPRGLA